MIAETQIPFSPRLFVLGDGTVLMGGDKCIRHWVQTTIMIGWQIILKGWKTEGGPSVQEWAAEKARVAAFKKMSYKQLGRLDVYIRKWGKWMVTDRDHTLWRVAYFTFNTIVFQWMKYVFCSFFHYCFCLIFGGVLCCQPRTVMTSSGVRVVGLFVYCVIYNM